MNRVEAIRRSQRCFVLGLIGLFPLIGIPAAFLARSEFHQVRRSIGQQWNPARKYLLCGGVFSYMTLGPMAAILIGLVLIAMVNLTFL